jgi:hypothetical protein
MTMRDISRRLDRLDSARPVANRRVVVMQRRSDEPASAAIARWCEAHPGEPAPSENDPNVLIVMHVIHKPPHREAA